jgi:F-type H+-transporting ATPase subunit delta
MATTQHNSSAAAFAQALLELAIERQQVDVVAGEMAGIRTAIVESPSLGAFFSNPSIKDAERQGVLNRALLPQVSPLVGNFLRLLLSKGKLGQIGAVAAAYQELMDKRQGKVNVDVTVTKALGPQELELVRQRISTAIQKEAVIKQHVDASIIGGIIIRVGDKLIDGSVKSQLQSIEKKLMATTV